MTARELQPMVRAWTTPAERVGDQRTSAPAAPHRPHATPSPWVLVFDTETTTDLGQRLRLITYQIRYRGRLKEHGIALAPRTPAHELALVADYCRQHGLTLLTVEEFLDTFFRIGYDRRSTIIGFNLPFDLSRLARRHALSRPRGRAWRKMRRGFTLTLSKWATRPAIRIKRISPRAAFIEFTAPEGRLPEHRNQARGGQATGVFRGFFLDVGTLAGALLGQKGTLASLAATLGVAEKLTIDEDTLGGPITEQLLDYAIRDTETTYACYEALLDRYQALGLSTPAHRILSEASIAKAHLNDLGIRPWRDCQPDAPDWLIATAMETYYGGRTETRIRRVLTPGVLVDVISEYPTVFALMGLSRYLIAEGVDWHDEDPVETTRWLADLTVDKLLDPATWPHLTRLVQLQPGPADVLPTRGEYAGDGVYNVAHAHRSEGAPAQWYTLADAATSTIATGAPPRILRTLAFTPRQPQDGLTPLLIAGRHELNPYTDDLITTLVELRDELRHSDDLTDQAAAAAIKATVNSVAYGIPIEVNTTPETGGATVTVHQPDATTYTARVPRSEEPGQYFHPLIATWVAGAGRLLLALIMRMVTDQGGCYAFCDTDSLFIAATREGDLLACPGGDYRNDDGAEAIELLSWVEVAGIVDRLRVLNPYQGPLGGRSILKIEADNFDPERGEQREIHAYAVASKRYALVILDPDGRPRIIHDQSVPRRSEHGLGHLLPPAGIAPGVFYDQWWDHGLHQALGLPHEEPGWLDDAALGRLTITNPTDAAVFTTYNSHRSYRDHIRPWGFGATATPTPPEQARTGARILVSPYTRNPQRRREARWVDRDQPSRTYRIRTGDDSYVLEDTVTVIRLRDYYADYFAHPESKADASDDQPCRTDSVGLLRAPTVAWSGPLGRIGKETNRVTTDTDVSDTEGAGLVYVEKQCRGCASAISSKRDWCSDRCRKRTARTGTMEAG